jgi:hypothetical protein
VDPVPDPVLLGNSGNAGNRTRTSGSVTRNWPQDHRGGPQDKGMECCMQLEKGQPAPRICCGAMVNYLWEDDTENVES